MKLYNKEGDKTLIKNPELNYQLVLLIDQLAETMTKEEIIKEVSHHYDMLMFFKEKGE